MSLNNVNGSQPRLLTFAEMGYAPQAPQTQAPATPVAQGGTDVADLSNKQSKKKVSKGVIAAIATVAAAALAAVGLAVAGKKATGAEKLFTKANFAAGFEKLKALPGELIAKFRRDEALEEDWCDDDLFEDAGARMADFLSEAAEEAAEAAERGGLVK